MNPISKSDTRVDSIPSMQEVIRRLHAYWEEQGCTIWQPHSEKVGAGTMNPGTLLRVLGPEPWRVAYVEPSYRADDGRYAENPNRMQMHTQYQVILKPDPGNSQELYLASLEAIGLDRTRHDIRFVEDNWESPALGAWGLGWEVWLDGQEITQFTYFQQAGGLTLDPVSVEITYGIERIVMYLQQKSEVWEIDFDGQHSYAQIYRNQEIEHCVYNFELADVNRQKMLYEIYQAEAEAAIERGLIVPAYDLLLRQSQTFNILDARGAVGVTERAKFFGDMRSQARRIAEAYVEQRERDEYPWLDDEMSTNGALHSNAVGSTEGEEVASVTSAAQTFLLELGSEELPPNDVVDGITQVQLRLANLLDEHRLEYQGLHVSGTPRRIVARVSGLAPSQKDERVERRGPPADRAFLADGTPTKAAQGFARGQGVDVTDLEVRDNYVYAVSNTEGRPTLEVLPEIIHSLLEGLNWNRSMRWNETNISYPRPLRWITALFGPHIVPIEWAGVKSGRISRGPRYRDAAADLQAGAFTTFSVEDADAYDTHLAQQGIVLERESRRQQIAEAVEAEAAKVEGFISLDAELLEEVTDLVESPTAVLGSFEKRFLQVPRPVLVGVMKKHQRYFAVVDQSGELLPYFVTIANSDQLANPDVVRRGNEGVLRARYADAEFFWQQDTRRPFPEFTERLATLTFHAQLGSMLDKVRRLERLAPRVARMLNADDGQVTTVERAAALSKTDLVTSMVVEMTSLQGVMGEIYAGLGGESPEVGRAIREHYLPRFSGDNTPESVAGLALSLADKLDSLAGLFGVGVRPRGSADPFGLRRAALGVISSLIASRRDFSIEEGLQTAAAGYEQEISQKELNEAGEFVSGRLQGVLREMGFAHDVVESVLAERSANPYAAQRAAVALSEMVAASDWSEHFTAYARCARIVRNLEEEPVLNPDRYEEQVERDLHRAYLDAQQKIESADEPSQVLGAVLADLQPAIDRFFEAVLVNADDEELRQARLALVQGIAHLPSGIADLSRLQGF